MWAVEILPLFRPQGPCVVFHRSPEQCQSALRAAWDCREMQRAALQALDANEWRRHGNGLKVPQQLGKFTYGHRICRPVVSGVRGACDVDALQNIWAAERLGSKCHNAHREELSPRGAILRRALQMG